MAKRAYCHKCKRRRGDPWQVSISGAYRLNSGDTLYTLSCAACGWSWFTTAHYTGCPGYSEATAAAKPVYQTSWL